MFRHKKNISLVLLLVLSLFVTPLTGIPKVSKISAAEDDLELVTSFDYADGVTRYVKQEKVAEEEYYNVFQEVSIDGKYLFSYSRELGFDCYGTIWYLKKNSDNLWWCTFNPYTQKVSRNPGLITSYSSNLTSNVKYDDENQIINAESLLYDNNGKYVIGIKLTSGDIIPTLTLDEQNNYLRSINEPETYDFSTYLPPSSEDEDDDPTPTPASTPTTTPTPTPSNSSSGSNTGNNSNSGINSNTGSSSGFNSDSSTTSNEQTAASEEETSSTTLSIKNESGYKVLYKGDTVVNKYKLKKKVLTFKKKKYKKVKSAAFIKKSGNIVFITTKGKAYLLTKKGKKKTLCKKGAKKIVTSKKFATKIKRKSGKAINVTKK